MSDVETCSGCEHSPHGDSDCGVVVGYDHLNGYHECGCPGPADDRLITCPECRSTFEAEDVTVFDLDGAVRQARVEAWEQGYARGVLDEVRELEPADNPYK